MDKKQFEGHTPGNWQFRDGKIRGAMNGSSSASIASIHGDATSEGKANARLIAAAPELLAENAALGSVHRRNPRRTLPRYAS